MVSQTDVHAFIERRSDHGKHADIRTLACRWDGAMIMLQMRETGPKVYDGQPLFKQFLGIFANKWIYGKDPVQCAPLLVLPHCW